MTKKTKNNHLAHTRNAKAAQAEARNSHSPSAWHRFLNGRAVHVPRQASESQNRVEAGGPATSVRKNETILCTRETLEQQVGSSTATENMSKSSLCSAKMECQWRTNAMSVLQAWTASLLQISIFFLFFSFFLIIFLFFFSSGCCFCGCGCGWGVVVVVAVVVVAAAAVGCCLLFVFLLLLLLSSSWFLYQSLWSRLGLEDW